MEKIVITHSGRRIGLSLVEALRRSGYFVQVTTSLDDSARLLSGDPALWLCEAHLLVSSPAQLIELARQRLPEECRVLVFCTEEHDCELRPPWADGILPRPDDAEDVVFRVASLLTIRRLTYERNLAQDRLVEKQLEYQRGLASAAQIQHGLLPATFPAVSGLRFAARLIPCAQVGGDLYNVVQLDESTIMVYLLDVGGHDLSSAMVAVSVFQSLSLHTGQIVKVRCAVPPYYRIPSPAEVLTLLDQEFPFERFEKLFTLCYLLIDLASGTVRYSSAGHPPALLLRADGSSSRLEEGGSPIGIGGHQRFGEGTVSLTAGDRIYLYSDGIIEQAAPEGELFGEERLRRRLTSQHIRPLDAVCGKVIEALHDFGRGGLFKDDVTLLGVEYTGETTGG